MFFINDYFTYYVKGQFWNSFNNQMPNLTELALILLNIPSSSAFIERVFSIPWAICEQRRGNMSDSLIIHRSMLKTNLDIVEKLNLVKIINDQDISGKN